MDANELKGLQANITSVLREQGGSRNSARGIVRHQIRPVAAAVVIGIGGTGIQVISRVRAAVHADRPDQDAISSLTFLGIDAVDETKQNPPLPAGVTLSGGEFLNLAGFDAHNYLAGQTPNDAFLRSWWDDDYVVPRGPLTEGLKRERMLGRLCFHRWSTMIQSRISTAMAQANAVRSQHIAAGQVASAGSIVDVYLVSSCAGGTGSSGFLETVLAVHAAAQSLSLVPRIRAFVFLPGVFNLAVNQTPNGAVAAQAQRANAFGFFKELDHFLLPSSLLPEAMGQAEVAISDGNLIHQVFLFDGKMANVGLLNSVTDVYEVASETIYQMLLTAMGRALVGADLANTERALAEVDRHGRPRRYCGMGLARIVFPGDTYRTHLVMRWCDWMTRGGFLRGFGRTDIDSSDVEERTDHLLELISRLTVESAEAYLDEFMQSVVNRGRAAPNDIKRKPTVEYAMEIMSELDRDAPIVQRELEQAYIGRRPRLIAGLRASVEEYLFSDGASVPQARDLLARIEKRVGRLLSASEGEANIQAQTSMGARTVLEERFTALEEAASRNLLEQAGAYIASIFRDTVLTTPQAGKAAGNAVADWTTALVRAASANARLEFLRGAQRNLRELREELDRAQERLLRLAGRSKAGWENDELIGKDTGPLATTTFIPADALPEVEWSTLSVASAKAIDIEHRTRLDGQPMAEFLARWTNESSCRGFFDLGSDDPTVAAIAEDTLLASMERDALLHALHTVDEHGQELDRLPANLTKAAERSGDPNALGLSLRGLEQASRSVCWSWDIGRFHPNPIDSEGHGRAATIAPVVVTAIAHHKSVAGAVEEVFAADKRVEFDDPERIVALSCEWALPLHCLPVVNEWRQDYLLLQRRRAYARKQGMPIEPPSHIDRRFEQLDDPIPEYFEAPVAAERVVQGLVMATLLGDPKLTSRVSLCFVRDATLEPVSPIRRDKRRKEYVGRAVVLENGVIRPLPKKNDTPLGDTIPALVRNVGLNVGLQSAIALAWDVFYEKLPAKTMYRALDDLLAPNGLLLLALRSRTISADTTDSVGYLINAAEDLRDQLAPDLMVGG